VNWDIVKRPQHENVRKRIYDLYIHQNVRKPQNLHIMRIDRTDVTFQELISPLKEGALANCGPAQSIASIEAMIVRTCSPDQIDKPKNWVKHSLP